MTVNRSSARSGTSICGYSFEQNQRRGVAQGAGTDVAVEIELDADRHIRPDHPTDMGEHIAFAVVVAPGHHRAIAWRKQHGVDRHRCPKIDAISSRKDS